MYREDIKRSNQLKYLEGVEYTPWVCMMLLYFYEALLDAQALPASTVRRDIALPSHVNLRDHLRRLIDVYSLVIYTPEGYQLTPKGRAEAVRISSILKRSQIDRLKAEERERRLEQIAKKENGRK